MLKETPGQMLWVADIFFNLKSRGQTFFTCPLQTSVSLAVVMGKHRELSDFFSSLLSKETLFIVSALHLDWMLFLNSDVEVFSCACSLLVTVQATDQEICITAGDLAQCASFFLCLERAETNISLR